MSGERRALRVVIADDHSPTRDDLRRALSQDHRFEVCGVAANAPEAVRMAVRESPDACVLDVRMPGGGVAAAWEITARAPRTKIVMLTVSDSDEDLFAAVRAGAHGYLLKTISPARVADAVFAVCRGEAAIPPAMVARLLERFRDRDPRWRTPAARAPGEQRLTSREWEVLGLLAQGRSTADIAATLVLSPSAIRVHIASIVRKLGVRDRAAAIDLFRSDLPS